MRDAENDRLESEKEEKKIKKNFADSTKYVLLQCLRV
jgi:hypothetical protein